MVAKACHPTLAAPRRQRGALLITVMVILAALSLLAATAAGIATMEAQLAGNFKRSISGGLSADYAAWETLRAYQDFESGTLVGATTDVTTAWSAAYPPTGAALAYGPGVLSVGLRAAREHDLQRYGLGYTDAPYLHHQNGAPDWNRITAANRGRIIYFGYGDPADPVRRGYYTTDAATMNPPVLVATVPNRFGAAYGTREYLLMRSPGPPLYATVAVAGAAHITNDGHIAANAATACGTQLNAAAISEGLLAASLVANLHAQYSAHAADWDGDAAVATGVHRLTDADLHADGSGILLVQQPGTQLHPGVTWNGLIVSLADDLKLSAWSRINGAVIASGNVTLLSNATVAFDSCALFNALSPLPAYRIVIN